MNKPELDQAAPESTADPEILALLEFEPVPRKVQVEDGWTPEAQRAFIARLAVHGSPTQACDAMGKNRTGVAKLYRSPAGESFRAAWDGAVALARRRKAEAKAKCFIDPGVTPPSVDYRFKPRNRGPAGEGATRRSDHAGGEELNDAGLPEDEDAKWDLIHGIGAKFMRKVAAERAARLAGEIVAADFYLRQVTFLEVLLDLASEKLGLSPHEVLHDLRRGNTKLMQIASTPLSDWLDRSRRLWWLEEGEPERPEHPDVRFLERRTSAQGDYAVTVDQHAYGAMTTPARGFSQEQWAQMDHAEQRAARQAQFEQDARAQVEWERRAHDAWEASEHGAGAHRDFENRSASST